MNKILILLMLISSFSIAGETVLMNPNDVKLGSVLHSELSEALLKRIRTLSDTFEIVDGISYEKSVDLYKRDLDPESNIVIYEEMARVYNKFCASRCSTQDERMDVYRLVLLRSMFSNEETLKRANLKAVSTSEAVKIVGLYKLKEQPIVVIQK